MDESFAVLWEKVAQIINDVAEQYDKKWRVRQRLINSMLIILLGFRLVCSKNSQSYGTTIDELWDSCHKLNLPLPQKGSIASSSFCAARKKLDETVFRDINRKIIQTYSDEAKNESHQWHGHRIFAVDGSRINLPRGLLNSGYKLMSNDTHYPQGLLSCLYQVKSQIPFDFTLVPHINERACAEQHLQVLEKDDIVVYDRGYYSYLLLHHHFERGIHPVFRLQKNSSAVIDEFFLSPQTDALVSITPASTTRREILAEYPHITIVPIPLRLIKYQIGDETTCLATTLLDQNRYTVQDFIEIYHSRWSIEELYKTGKRMFVIEDFHAQTERGVKQEIFAHFVLVTMNRLFANQAEIDLNVSGSSTNQDGSDRLFSASPSDQPLRCFRINFKHCIHMFTQSIEELVLLHAKMKGVIERVFLLVRGRYQKERPGRSYQRKSMRPETKWRAPRKRKKDRKVSNPTAVLNPGDIVAVS